MNESRIARIVIDKNGGNPRLRLRGSVDGKLVFLKTVKGIGAEAEAKIKAFAEAEGWEIVEAERATGSLRFADLVALFLKSYDKTSNTHETKSTRGKELTTLVEYFGERFVNDLTKDDIEDYKASRVAKKGVRKGQPVRGTTLRSELTAFRQVINWANENKLPGVNISARIAKNPKDSRPRTGDAPTEQEIHQLVTGAVLPWHERLIILGFYTGLRVGPSELFRLSWRDVRWNDDPSKVYLEAPNSLKGVVRYGDTRKVPVNQHKLLPYLRGWYQADMAAGISEDATILRTSKNEPVKIVVCSKTWKVIFKRAGMDVTRRYFRPYDLRAGFVTHCASQGVDRRAVIKAVGHSNSAMIETYYDRVKFEDVQAEINTKLAGGNNETGDARYLKIIEDLQAQNLQLQSENHRLQAKLDQFSALLNGAD